MLSEVWFWIYVSILGFFAGVIGTVHRQEHRDKNSLKARAFVLWFGGVTGMLIAYVVGEISFYFSGNQRVSIALSVATAWVGAKVLLELQNRILDFIGNYKKGDK